MVTITIPIDRLRRALDGTIPFASADDTLPLLNTIQVKFEGDRVQFSATDRYALGTYRLHRGERTPDGDEFAAPDDAEHASGTVKLSDAKEMLRIAKRYKRQEALREVTLTIREGDMGGVSFDFPDGPTYNTLGISGDYPPVDRLFPAGEHLATSDQSEVVFNPEFAAKVNKAALAINTDRMGGVLLRLNTDAVKPAVFRLNGDDHWRCLLMPMRG